MVLQKNKFFVESPYPEVLSTLLKVILRRRLLQTTGDPPARSFHSSLSLLQRLEKVASG